VVVVGIVDEGMNRQMVADMDGWDVAMLVWLSVVQS
jgi:hypothetical protein